MPKSVPFALLWVAACGSRASWVTGEARLDGVTEADRPAREEAAEACRDPERLVATRADARCCVRAPAITLRAEHDPACAPPQVGPDQVAALVCMPGDPVNIAGLKRWADGRVAILTESHAACGGMVRASRTAAWVALPATSRTAAIASCKTTREDCRGAPRP